MSMKMAVRQSKASTSEQHVLTEMPINESANQSNLHQNGNETSDAPDKREITFESTRNGTAKYKVVARLGDEIVACDCFDVDKAKARNGFIASICGRYPGIDRDKAERDLLALAAKK